MLRDHAGSARAPLNPVAAGKQRAALKMLATEVFSADSFRFKPDFLRRASIRLLRHRAQPASSDAAVPTPDVAIDQQVLALQRVALNR